MLNRITALALLLLPATLAFAQPATTLPEPVARALAQAGIPESAVGVYVHEIGADQPVLSVGAERSLNPASTMKLVTTYAGLEMLGPAYVWNTDVLTDGTLTQDVLNGNLYIKGAGDPKLTVESFWLLLRNLRARGVREIRGDLILDRRLFAEEVQDPGAFDDQPTRPYNTGPSALLVNFKAVTLQFIPDAATRTVRIAVEPPLAPVQIINNLKIADGPCGDWVGKLRLDSQGNADSARLAFNGTYALDCGESMRSFSVLGHRQYIGALFTQLWKDLGGSFAGQVRDGATPDQARRLTTARSLSLSEIVRDVNKYSNNVMARQLFLSLGMNNGAQATTATAATGVKQWLALKGLASGELFWESMSFCSTPNGHDAICLMSRITGVDALDDDLLPPHRDRAHGVTVNGIGLARSETLQMLHRQCHRPVGRKTRHGFFHHPLEILRPILGTKVEDEGAPLGQPGLVQVQRLRRAPCYSEILPKHPVHRQLHTQVTPRRCARLQEPRDCIGEV